MRQLVQSIGIWLMLSTSLASDSWRDLPSYYVQDWGLEDGLPQVTISSILQSKDGYLWVGTQHGISRFDGFRFQNLSNQGPEFLSESNIHCLVESHDGTLWLGTSHGLVYYYGGAFGSYEVLPQIQQKPIGGLVLDGEDALWIGVKGGLAKYSNRNFEWFEAPHLLDAEINGLAMDRLGRIWIATKMGLRFYHQGTFHRFGEDRGLEGKNIHALYTDRRGKVWASVQGLGLVEIQSDQLEMTSFPVPENRIIRGICRNPEGGLWLGVEKLGLMRFENDQFSIFGGEGNWTYEDIQTLLVDAQERLWIGTRFGLKQLSRKVYQRIDHLPELEGVPTWSAYEDPKGRLWVGTQGRGLILVDGNMAQVFTEQDGLPSNIVNSVNGEENGSIWIGTQGGLARLQAAKVEIITDTEGQPRPETCVIFVDSENRVWVGTKNGLSIYEHQVLRSVDYKPLAKGQSVRFVDEDSQQRIWIGTDSGLYVVEAGTFRDITGETGVGGSFLNMYEDSQGDIWIGTYSKGLLRYRQGHFKRITHQNGLFSNTIFSILPDDSDHFWMTTHTAASMVRRADLNQFLDGRLEQIQVLAIGAAQDPDFGELNGGSFPSGIRTKDGTLLFPGSKGLIAIEPENVKGLEVVPQVLIESIGVDEKLLKPTNGLEIPSESRRFEFKFTGLSYLHGDKIKFQVKLEPIEQQWQDVGFARHKEYFNIPPGKYVFRVRVENAYGLKSEDEAAINFYLQPKFYETEFFLLICVVGLILLIAALHQWRLRKSEARRIHLEKLVQARTQALEASNLELQKAQDKLVRAAHYAGKAEIATDVLHSVGNALNSVVVSTSLLEDQTRGLKTDLYEKLVPLLEKYKGRMDHYLSEDPRGVKVLPTMQKMGRALRKYRETTLEEIEGLNNMVQHIKQIISDQQRHADMGMYFETVSLDQLIEEALELQAGTINSTHVQLEKDIEEGIMVRVPKIAFLQVLINLIKNACEASTRLEENDRLVSLRAFLKGPGWVHMEIRDQGLGIDKTDITRIFRQGYTTKPGANGFGLHFCGNIISELKGQISVRSEGVGSGSTFLLDLPVAQTIQS